MNIAARAISGVPMRARLTAMMFAQYFAIGAWLSPLGAYMSKKLQFDGSIGTAYGMLGFAAIVSALFVGTIADRYYAAQKMFGLLALAAGLSLFWLSTIEHSKSLFLAVMALHCLFFMPLVPLATAISFSALERPAAQFPLVRAGGTAGWIVAGLLIGAIPGATQSDLPMRIAAVTDLLLALYAFTLPNTPPKARGGKLDLLGVLGLDIIFHTRDRNFWVLMGCMLAVAVPSAAYNSYASNFLVESGMVLRIGGLRLEPAGILTLGNLFEIGFLAVLPALLKRLGIKNVMLIGMAAWIVRFGLFSWGWRLHHNGQALLLAAITLHGVSFDFLFVSSQIFINNKFADTARVRAQSFLSLVCNGVGVIVGANLVGVIYKAATISPGNHDWPLLWLAPAALVALIMPLFALSFRVVKPVPGAAP